MLVQTILENSLKTSYFVLSTRINLIILLSCLDWESSWLLLSSGQQGEVALHDSLPRQAGMRTQANFVELNLFQQAILSAVKSVLFPL